MEAPEYNENLNILNLEDESWNNCWPVEVRMDAPEDLVNEGETKKYDSDSDFMGFEDTIPATANNRSRPAKEINGCPHCEYSTRRKDHFKRHVLRHPEQTLYPLDGSTRKERKPHYCSACGYNTIRTDHFKRHMMRHTGEKPFSCSCGYSSTHSIHIKRHALRHGHTPSPHPVQNKVSEKLLMPEKIKDELLVSGGADSILDGWVSGVWPPNMKLEVSEFTMQTEELHHRKSKNRGRPQTCVECGYSTMRGDHFKRHLMRHTGEKPYSCSLCEYKSTHAVHLKRHMATHTNDRPYACHFCSFRAIRPYHLRDHIRIHTGEKPYICNKCGFSTAQSTTYRSHMKSHPEEKPFVCHLCGYSTVKHDNLVSHIMTHTGEKKFVCEFCNYSAVKSSDVIRHTKRKHSEIYLTDNNK